MHLTALSSTEAFEKLAVEWSALLRESASAVPFLEPAYLKNWWNTLGGGEWSHGDLYVVTARGEDGQLRGVAPLFASENPQGEPSLMLIGSIEISDYLDLIARPEDSSRFASALLETLDRLETPAWKTLDLYNLREDSPSLPALQVAAKRCGWRFELQPLQHCPYIPLPGDWETYLAGIDKKQRHEIRRKMRRLEEQALPVRWYIVQDADRLEAEMQAFLDLMVRDAEKAAFLTQPMRNQMLGAMQAAFQAGWLQLAFIEIGGQKAAAFLNFDYAGHVWVYNSGLNNDFRELSPGWVLLARLLQWANENGRSSFDFMRGDEDYKYRFGAIDRRVVRATIRR